MSEWDAALETFYAESRELLEAMEAALLVLESEPGDAEAINGVFRAAHTIKGSAGLFGLERIVVFTHHAETLLDRVRDGELSAGAELVALLLACRDFIGELVDGAEAGDPQGPPACREQELLAALAGYLGDDSGAGAPAPAAAGVPAPQAGERLWHVSARFGRDVLRQGMDPLAFVGYLASLGTIEHTVGATAAIPTLADLDPESCYLGFELALRSSADQAAIETTFEFVRDESSIHVIPADGDEAPFRALLEARAEERDWMCDTLNRCGTADGAALRRAADAPAAAPAAPERRASGDRRQGDRRHIRIDAGKLDDLINRVGELVIAGAAASLRAQGLNDSEMVERTAAVTQIVEQIRDGALQLRMVQIGDTFNRFKRVVHDVSRELDKHIDLDIAGADTELDKTVVEQIGDPLTHLIRNAIDHGIEPPQLRRARGKPAAGSVRLNAYHESGGIVIEVADDGGGIDRERLRAKAVARGLIGEDQVLPDPDLYALIFEPGLSTAEQVSDLSGRGVGMDVVRRNIEALRGTVEVESQAGEGTTLRIRLPLTLAIIEGFLMRVGRSMYVVPLDMVAECIELGAGDRGAMRGRDFINLRGEVLPFVRLRQFFRESGEPARRENIIVVEFAGRKAGLLVDELLGEFQTVIKPLGKLFQQIPGISGSTILGSGRVALILDIHALLQYVGRREEHHYQAALSA